MSSIVRYVGVTVTIGVVVTKTDTVVVHGVLLGFV